MELEKGFDLMNKKRIVIIILCLVLLISGISFLTYVLIRSKNQENNKDKEQDIIEDYIIIDETDTCNENLEEIYRDEENIYYLNCVKSDNIFLKYNTGKNISLIEALNQKIVSINELIEKGLDVQIVEISSLESEDDNSDNVSNEIENNKGSNKNNNSSNNSNSDKSDNTNTNSNDKPNETNSSEDETPLMSWQILDFAISKYGNKEKAMQKCQEKGDEFAGYYSYYCTDVLNKSGTLIGYMLRVKEFNTGNDYNWR